MKDVLVGRVDLVRALCAGGEELQEALADLLGFERKAEVPQPPKVDTGPGQPPEPRPEPEPAPVRIHVPFWQAHDFEAREPLAAATRPYPSSPRRRLIGPVHLPPASLASGADDPDPPAPVTPRSRTPAVASISIGPWPG